MSTKFSFLCALPRTGATFLGSMINQSKQIQMTPNSILPDVVINILKTRESSVFKNFPYFRGLENILLNTFDNYYKDIPTHVLEKAPWGTPYNLELLRCVFPDRKFVILVRPILECLASFVKAKTDKSDVDSFCDALMNPDSGILGKNIWSINNLIDEEEQHIVITYDELAQNPQKQIDKIFQFLQLKPEKLSLTKQFSFGDMQYDDQHVEGPFHSIRLDKVGKINYKVEDYLPRRIIERYENISIRTTGIR
jgi:hypothetical protein